jgi:hypothetical protein
MPRRESTGLGRGNANGLSKAFGVEFLERLVPGDPWGRRGMDEYFERPTEYSETA